MANGVPEIQRGPQACLGFVLRHDLRLDGAASGDDGRQYRRLLLEEPVQLFLQPLEQGGIIDHAVLHDLSDAGTQFPIGKRGQGVQVTKDQTRLMESTHQIFASLKIHSNLATHGTVNL